jgi:hypothetical protein
MEDKERIIICNINAGGQSISLHNKNGNHPRTSIISPSWSAQYLIQSLGRIYRSGVKTETYQYILFGNSKIEQMLYENVKDKLNNIGLLNNGITNNPNLQIKHLINSFEDTQNNFSDLKNQKLHIKKQEKLMKLKQIEEEQIKQKQNEKIKKNIQKPFDALDFDKISDIIDKLYYKLNITENSDLDIETKTSQIMEIQISINEYCLKLDNLIKNMIV